MLYISCEGEGCVWLTPHCIPTAPGTSDERLLRSYLSDVKCSFMIPALADNCNFLCAHIPVLLLTSNVNWLDKKYLWILIYSPVKWRGWVSSTRSPFNLYQYSTRCLKELDHLIRKNIREIVLLLLLSNGQDQHTALTCKRVSFEKRIYQNPKSQNPGSVRDSGTEDPRHRHPLPEIVGLWL